MDTVTEITREQNVATKVWHRVVKVNHCETFHASTVYWQIEKSVNGQDWKLVKFAWTEKKAISAFGNLAH